MKVGGNESATKYFQTHGGSAALASKDPKAKYTSNAATKYKEELSRRVAIDAKQCATHYPTYTYAFIAYVISSYLTPTRYPEEVVITDISETDSGDGTSTPGETDDDFFSSWDKPTIKRPSNPPSRTGTPLSGSRTASPFLNAPANGNGIARPKSPLSGGPESTPPAPPASRTTSSSAIRKTTTGAASRKTNILGAKKAKLGAKKLTPTDGGLDFEAAERKAREEAERIEKLGYDPEAEKAADAAAAKGKAASTEAASIVSPTPVSPPRAGFGATKPERSSAEMERLGMGIGRLGFGQVGGAKPAAAPRKMGGFGSTSRAVEGTSLPPIQFCACTNIPLPADDSEKYARQKFGTQKSISSDEFFGRAAYDPSASAAAKERLQGFEGATSISSNAYFGRPEDEPEDDYGDLEGAAKDFVRKFGLTAGDDIENMAQLVGDGASRLRGAIMSYLNS